MTGRPELYDDNTMGTSFRTSPVRRTPAALGVLLAALLLGIIGCRRPREAVDSPAADAAGPPWFEDVTARVGLDFVHDPGPTGTYFTPQSMGSGCAFFDCDGDGLADIYLLQLGGPNGKKNQLFKQLPDHTFKNVSAGSGLDVAGYSHGIAIGDVNNDGKPDVLVTQFGGIKLFLNLGGGKFEDVTLEAGLVNPLWAMSAAFVDYDRDGRLDLVVVNYLDHDPSKECVSPRNTRDYCGPNYFPGVCSKLFRNIGARSAADGKPAARVRFDDVGFASGIGRVPGPGLGVVCADFDGDGWQDIFVANDGLPNRLWINQKDGTFKDEAASRGVAYTVMGNSYAGMGIAVGDTTGSGMFDVFVTHLDTQTHTLWRQGPRGMFRDATASSQLAIGQTRCTGWGTVMADFDLDGAPDVAVVNCRVNRGRTAKDTGLGFWQDYAEHNQLYANDGQGKFRDLSSANSALCGIWNVGRGLAVGDFDNDGAPDLLVTSTGGAARLFRNVARQRGHWLRVRALEPPHNRDAHGAEVRVRAGDRQWLRLVHPAQSYLSSCTPLALFGLGRAEHIDGIEVTWPDGARELFAGGGVDCQRDLRRGEGRTP
jgi:hypothetical protein